MLDLPTAEAADAQEVLPFKGDMDTSAGARDLRTRPRPHPSKGYLGRHIAKHGVRIVQRPGGHANYIDAGGILPHTPKSAAWKSVL